MLSGPLASLLHLVESPIFAGENPSEVKIEVQDDDSGHLQIRSAQYTVSESSIAPCDNVFN